MFCFDKYKRTVKDIALGVDSAMEYKGNEDRYNSVGAEDQGMMFGYACTETDEFTFDNNTCIS